MRRISRSDATATSDRSAGMVRSRRERPGRCRPARRGWSRSTPTGGRSVPSARRASRRRRTPLRTAGRRVEAARRDRPLEAVQRPNRGAVAGFQQPGQAVDERDPPWPRSARWPTAVSIDWAKSRSTKLMPALSAQWPIKVNGTPHDRSKGARESSRRTSIKIMPSNRPRWISRTMSSSSLGATEREKA